MTRRLSERTDHLERPPARLADRLHAVEVATVLMIAGCGFIGIPSRIQACLRGLISSPSPGNPGDERDPEDE